MTDSGRRRLHYGVSAEREVARFRLVSALVVLPAAMATMVLAAPLAAKVIASMGIGVSIAWIVAFFRARRRLRGSGSYHLDIDQDGLTIALGTTETALRQRDVEAVEVDEERLVVVVRLTDGATVEVPPVWEGVGLHELRDLIVGTWDGAPRRRDG